MPVVTLPDGSHRSFAEAVTVHDVAADIGAGLAKAALAGKVDGTLVDTSHLIEHDAQLAIITERDEDGLDVIRHSTAHLLAMAVKELFPEAQVTIGPVISDGFYYDFKYDRPFTNEDLGRIEKRMAERDQARLAGFPLGDVPQRRRRACSVAWVKSTKFALLKTFPAQKTCHFTARVTSSTCAAGPSTQHRSK